ncbi:MAG: hypothetical protein ABJQ14_12940 [Hyphomicrobiales bacterium]
MQLHDGAWALGSKRKAQQQITAKLAAAGQLVAVNSVTVTSIGAALELMAHILEEKI